MVFSNGRNEGKAVEWNDGKSFDLEFIGGKVSPPYRFMLGKIELKGYEKIHS